MFLRDEKKKVENLNSTISTNSRDLGQKNLQIMKLQSKFNNKVAECDDLQKRFIESQRSTELAKREKRELKGEMKELRNKHAKDLIGKEEEILQQTKTITKLKSDINDLKTKYEQKILEVKRSEFEKYKKLNSDSLKKIGKRSVKSEFKRSISQGSRRSTRNEDAESIVANESD